LDHSVLVAILGERIHDNRFLRLIDELLKAGYLEDWTYHMTLSGSPQGSGVSPILANLYLDRLDRYVEQTLLPSYNRGTERRTNAAYQRLRSKFRYRVSRGRLEEARSIRKRMFCTPSRDPHDPNYRRLRYVRYADDILLGFCGPRHEAEAIKRQLGTFLRDELKLTLSETKTLITHARSQAARFLGYEIVTLQNDHKRDRQGQRSLNGGIGLKVPADVVRARCRLYRRRGKPVHLAARMPNAVFSIVAQYQQEYRGIVDYYRLAYNLHRFGRLKWIMEQSLTKTLAHKLNLTVNKVYRRYRTTIQTPEGPRKVLQIHVAQEGKPALSTHWGGISLKRQQDAVLIDTPTQVWNARTELVERLLADTCELCGAQGKVEVHHVRRLRDLQRRDRPEKPAWVQIMAARQRKTLVVCNRCHNDIHSGRIDGRRKPG
jgi:hypothetical protein